MRCFMPKKGMNPIHEEDEVDVSEGIVRLPESGTSLGRYPDGKDSDLSTSDFQTDMTPTPGLPNAGGTDISTDTGEDTDNLNLKEGGCNKNNQPTDPTDPSKCQSIPIEQSLFGIY